MELKHIQLICLLTLICGVAHAAPRKATAASLEVLMGVSEKWILQAAKTEPDLFETAQAAYRYANLDGDPAKEWRRKARQSAALPTLSLSVDTGYLNRANVSIQDSISVNSTGVTIGPASNNSNQYLTNQTMFTAKAVWSLSETLFHPQSLGIERENRNRISDRQKLLEQVNQLYHERIRIKATIISQQNKLRPETHGQALLQAALMQITGQLNLLTGGWFSMQINKET